MIFVHLLMAQHVSRSQ